MSTGNKASSAAAATAATRPRSACSTKPSQATKQTERPAPRS